MKKIAALLLSVVLLLCLVACGEKAASDDGATNNPGQTEPAEDTHTHSYTETVVQEATCTAEGTKTFTCSCGDTYTEAIPMQHAWGDWQAESYALVGKPGTEHRTCAVCSVTESQERTANAIANSFYDGGLVFFGTNDTCQLTGPGLLRYAVFTLPEYHNTPVKTAELFGKMYDRFDIPQELIDNAKYWGQMVGRYDDTSDTFTVEVTADEVEMGNLQILGYVHKGENRYAVYYQCNNGVEDRYCEFELEYNLLEGKANKYLSSGIVAELPDDMVKCAEGEQKELAD